MLSPSLHKPQIFNTYCGSITDYRGMKLIDFLLIMSKIINSKQSGPTIGKPRACKDPNPLLPERPTIIFFAINFWKYNFSLLSQTIGVEIGR